MLITLEKLLGDFDELLTKSKILINITVKPSLDDKDKSELKEILKVLETKKKTHNIESVQNYYNDILFKIKNGKKRYKFSGGNNTLLNSISFFILIGLILYIYLDEVMSKHIKIILNSAIPTQHANDFASFYKYILNLFISVSNSLLLQIDLPDAMNVTNMQTNLIAITDAVIYQNNQDDWQNYSIVPAEYPMYRQQERIEILNRQIIECQNNIDLLQNKMRMHRERLGNLIKNVRRNPQLLFKRPTELSDRQQQELLNDNENMVRQQARLRSFMDEHDNITNPPAAHLIPTEVPDEHVYEHPIGVTQEEIILFSVLNNAYNGLMASINHELMASINARRRNNRSRGGKKTNSKKLKLRKKTSKTSRMYKK
jgi:uncharacterized coiled-coil protein SlyX